MVLLVVELTPGSVTAGAMGRSDSVKRRVPLLLACAAVNVKRTADVEGVIEEVKLVPWD